MSEVKRYHPALIVLHWLLALAILGLFIMGKFVLDEMESTDPQKAGLLSLHLIAGITLLGLTVVRLIVRGSTARPVPIVTDKPLADKLAVGIHHLLYTLTIFAALAGLILAYSADLFNILFSHVGTLPEDYEDLAFHEVHELLAIGLIAVVALHIAGALKHQLILKDGIMSRMSLRGPKE